MKLLSTLAFDTTWSMFLSVCEKKHIIIIIINITHVLIIVTLCLQCFDTVGWAAGRASGL